MESVPLSRHPQQIGVLCHTEGVAVLDKLSCVRRSSAQSSNHTASSLVVNENSSAQAAIEVCSTTNCFWIFTSLITDFKILFFCSCVNNNLLILIDNWLDYG